MKPFSFATAVMFTAFMLLAATQPGCSAGQIKAADAGIQIAEASCVVFTRSVAPDSEALCATGKEIADAIVSFLPRKGGALSPQTPEQRRAAFFDSIKAARAKAKASVK